MIESKYLILIIIIYLCSIVLNNYVLFGSDIIIEKELNKSKQKALGLMSESEAEELIENTREVLNSPGFKIYLSFKILLERILTSSVFIIFLYLIEFALNKIKFKILLNLLLPSFVIILFRDWINLLISIFIVNELYVLKLPIIFSSNDFLAYLSNQFDYFTIAFIIYNGYRFAKYYKENILEFLFKILMVFLATSTVFYLLGFNKIIL